MNATALRPLSCADGVEVSRGEAMITSAPSAPGVASVLSATVNAAAKARTEAAMRAIIFMPHECRKDGFGPATTLSSTAKNPGQPL